MRAFKNLFVIVAAILLVIAYTGETLAADQANDTVLVDSEDKDCVVFYGIVQFLTAFATDNVTTQAIEGAQLDWENATLHVWGNAEAGIDVNAFLMGGPILDLTYMKQVYTQTAFDALGAATPAYWYALKDTLGAMGVNDDVIWFYDPTAAQKFKVLKFDGQTGNPNGANIYWYLYVPKKPGAPSRNAYGIFDTE